MANTQKRKHHGTRLSATVTGAPCVSLSQRLAAVSACVIVVKGDAAHGMPGVTETSRMPLTRRQVLEAAGATAVTLVRPSLSSASPIQGAQATPRVYTLEPLPYRPDALAPHFDAQTMAIHHDRHHQAYVTNLNAALAQAGPAAMRPLEDLLANLDQVPESVRTAVRNNGGGHVNHQQFWTLLSPGGGEPSGGVSDALRGTFGSVDAFKTAFGAAATSRFGSGWAWLSEDRGTLVIHSTAKQDTPSMEGKRAIFWLDVC